MKAIIRIRGQVNLDRKTKQTFQRLNLGRKYSCIVINPNKEQEGMIKKIRNLVAYGEISNEMLEKLIEKRAKLIEKNKKIDAKTIVDELIKGKKYKELNLKPFFRLHPPRGGIKSKLQYPKGVLGNHGEKINELIERML